MSMWWSSLWRSAAKLLVAVLAVSSAAAPVAAHGFLATPAARNVQHNSDWCPHCLNAGGPWKVYQRGRTPRYGVCGDAWDAPKHHEVGGKYATPPRIANTYRSGAIFTAVVRLTVNHKGRWSLRLCRLPGDGSPATERRALTQRCFNQHVLRRADGKGPFTLVPGTQYTFAVRYRLPRGVRCARCVLQWTYETGNSCNPPGIPRPTPGLDSCARSTNGEMFWNCADVRIL
jgi:hypothetical protein